MKRFLSILLAIMMVLSSVSYALPSAVETFDSASETQLPLDELFDEAENSSESAELSAVDATEYGELIVRFDMESITAGTDYTSALHSTSSADLNGIPVFGGQIGTGSNKDLTAEHPFLFDGSRSGSYRHTSVIGMEDASGNKYLQLTGAGTIGYFGMRDYNGSGFAKTGHYILTFDVLNADAGEFTGAYFFNSAATVDTTEAIIKSTVNGDWTTLAVSLDESSSVGTCNYMHILTNIASGDTASIDNITLWWVPAEVSFNLTHDVEGVLDDGAFTIGGGIKTIEEIEAAIDPDEKFTNAGYYLAGLRDENGYYTDSVVLNENGKSFTAVWDKLNILLGYSFDGTEDLTNVAPTGATGTVTDGAYVTTTTSDQASYRVNISNTSLNVADIGDIVYRMKSTGTGAFTTVYFVYVENSTTKTQDWKNYTVPSEYATISTTALWGLPSVWMSSISTLSSFRVQGSATTGAVVYYDYIYVLGKNKDAGDNVLVDTDAPDCDLNSFKVVFDSTTTAQSILDCIDTTGYAGVYEVDGLVAPDGTVLTGSDLIADYVDDEDVLTINWKKNEYVGEYGELIYEIDFDSATDGEFTYISNYGTNNSLSDFGGKTNSKFNVDGLYFMQLGLNDSSTYTIVNEGDGNKYLEINLSCTNVYNSPTYAVRHKTDIGFTDVSGYENGALIATYDVLADAGNSDASAFKIVFNGESLKGREYTGTAVTYPQKGEWGTVVSTFDKDLFVNDTDARKFSDIADVTRIIFQKQNSSTTSGIYGIDNIRLYWVPETVDITVPAGDNTSVSDQVFTIVPTDTTAADLATQVNAGTKELVGFSETEGGEILANDKLLSYAYNTTLYPVWKDLDIVETGLEFNDSSIISNLTFRTGKNNSLGSGFASIVDDSYMRLTFTATDTTQVVQDTGFNYTLPSTISAGSFTKMQMRVRFTGMPSSETTLNQAGGGTKPYNPASVAWPEMYYNNAAVYDTDNTISLADKDGEWFVITYTAEEMGLASLDLTQLRFDFFDFMPHGSTLDIDYIRFIASPLYHLTVDMGDNTSATPVSMSYNAVTTVSDVLSKIVDHGDKKFLGLSRTAGGDILSGAEMVGSGDEDVTLYAVWEDYEYLELFGYEFNDGVLPYSKNIVTNGADRTLSVQDGYLTIDLAAKDGYTGTWDTQIYLPLTTNALYNPSKSIPAGVVTNVTARIRFRGTGTESQSLTISGYSDTTFNPANPLGTYIHWGAPGNKWGTNLTSYNYDYNTLFPEGIVDGRWFTLDFSAASGNLNLYDNGVGYLRFDFPYPMPSGTKIDVDYIRLVGDNETLPDFSGEYGEKVLELNFDAAAEGSLTSNTVLSDLGAVFNPSFFISDYEQYTKLLFNNSNAELVKEADGTGNYMKYTATADSTAPYMFIRNLLGSEQLPFVEEDGYFIITYDLINSTSADVPHTFRINMQDKIEDAAENFMITENGDWDKVVLYYDKEIGSSGTKYHDLDGDGNAETPFTIDSTNDITIVKWHNTSNVKSGETICMDNITLWYVPKTVPVIIDNSAVGLENTIIEEYPTYGMTTEELSALLPTLENGEFVGLSATEGGTLVYENRAPVSRLFYSSWSVDTVLTVDMGDNKKLSNMTIQIPAGSSVKVSDIEAKFIDHGDKMFAGLSYTAGGTKLNSSESIAASDSGAVTIYALWNDYYTNDFYSVEFEHNGEGVVAGVSESHLNAGRNSAYRIDAKDADGNAAAGNAVDSLVWNEEEGYLTMKFDASAYAKAQAEEYGYTALIWDPFIELDSFYDATDDNKYLTAGDADYVVVRMRYRGMPAKNTAYWRADTSKAYTLEPDSVFAPFYYYTTTAGAEFGSPFIEKTVSLLEGSAYRDNWFTVFIPTSELEITDKNVYRFRIDPNDGMPDGSAIDIDFIRFIHTTDGTKNLTAPTSRQDRVSARVVPTDAARNGVRVLAEVLAPTKVGSAELGWMFTSSARWNASATDGSGSRSWYELKMDLYNENSTLIKVGFNKKDGVSKFIEQDDSFAAFAAVLYNIPLANYKSPFVVRPFAKLGNAYAYGEPFEINFLSVLEAVANADNASEDAITYYEKCQTEYAAYLDANASYNSSEVVAALNTVMSSASSIKSSLIIPSNDTAPTVNGNIVTMKAWKDGSLVTLNVSTKDTYPEIIDSTTGLISDAYAEKPCIYYLSDGVYYIKSLGRSTDAGGAYNGVEKNDASAMEANVDGSALFLSEITDGNVASPFQRLPIDDELTNGQDSFFLGDFATGEFEFIFQRDNSAKRTISTGKTGIIASDSKVVAKYNFPDGTTEWVSFAQAQLLKMGLDSDSKAIADGIDFTNLTYVVSNNTTSTTGVNQREYEDLAVLVGEVDVPATVNYTTTNFLAAKYNKVIVKTTSDASYVTVKFTRADGVSDSIKYYAYGTTTDGYRLFDVDLYGMAKYHSTISSLTVTANSGSVSYAYLVEDPDYYSSADLANMNSTMIFQDMNYDNGFYVRDMDQVLTKSDWQNYKFASNGNTPLWMIDPWYSYDYSGTKANYELYTNASETATTLTDTNGSKVVKFNGTKTSTYADGSSHTGNVLSLSLNARKIYNGMTHEEMKENGMVYWPHLLIEQSTAVASVDTTATSAGADKIFLEMDIKMTSYTYGQHSNWDDWFNNYGTKQLSFLLYSYLRPKDKPSDRIWFGASLCSNSATQYPTWNRDTGGSAYIYCMPQEVVFQGIANSFYQTVQDNIDKTGSGTSSTSKDWVHISIDVTPYIQTAIDWANREDAFGIGRALTRDDFYFDGVNIGFETHGNIDGTFEIANFNFVAYND